MLVVPIYLQDTMSFYDYRSKVSEVLQALLLQVPRVGNRAVSKTRVNRVCWEIIILYYATYPPEEYYNQKHMQTRIQTLPLTTTIVSHRTASLQGAQITYLRPLEPSPAYLLFRDSFIYKITLVLVFLEGSDHQYNRLNLLFPALNPFTNRVCK
jgi:hypothetical protein